MSLDLPKNSFGWFWARSNSFSFGDLTKILTRTTKVFTSTELWLSMATFKLKTQMWDKFKNTETLSQRNKLFLQRKQAFCQAQN